MGQVDEHELQLLRRTQLHEILLRDELDEMGEHKHEVHDELLLHILSEHYIISYIVFQ